jgi:protocatechuate 3,4-dioxygenase, alpha subunit
MAERTPSQTVGPYLHVGLMPAAYGVREVFGPVVAEPGIAGEHIRLEGRIIDGEGNVVTDAMVEIWQADHQGRYAHPADGRPLTSNSFRGFGRVPTESGSFRFATIKPGGVSGPDGSTQAPHINVGVFARGILKRLFTRIYFADEPAANASDPILALVPADRRETLLARPDPGTPGLYRFDIFLQGQNETVFFEA